MRPWEGINASRVDDPVLREQQHRIHLFLKEVSAAVGNVQHILGITGSEREEDVTSVPTVHDGSFVDGLTEGILAFGATDVPGRARPLLVNDDGELGLAELPNTTVKDTGTFPAGGYSNFPDEPPFVTDIVGHLHGKMEISGTQPSNAGRLTVAIPEDDDQGFDPSTPAVSERPTALVVMPTPKVYRQQLLDFSIKYFAGGAGGGTEVVYATGSHNPDGAAGDRQGVWRFTRGAVLFTTGVVGTPPDDIDIKLYGYATDISTDKILLREWNFNPTSFVDNLSTKNLRFDIDMPFWSLTITASVGSDATNYYEIANANVIFFSI